MGAFGSSLSGWYVGDVDLNLNLDLNINDETMQEIITYIIIIIAFLFLAYKAYQRLTKPGGTCSGCCSGCCHADRTGCRESEKSQEKR